jgi:predicted RNA methylase
MLRPDHHEHDDAVLGESAASPADDSSFDRVYPPAVRELSRRFWTPVGVARRAGELLRSAGARNVLDVGAGAGKFALVAAAAQQELSFVGIEQREPLVHVARMAAIRLGINNARFLIGDVTKVPWGDFDGFYFFNPLAENLYADEDCIDHGVELSESRFFHDVLRIESALRVAPLRTAVVSYHGTSGRMPTCYELSHSERAGSDWLRLWIKRRPSDDGSFFVDDGDFILRCRPVAKGHVS